MTMNEYIHRDHLRELWMHIEKLHLSYLQTDESPYKIEQRNKLESYIREYLCLAPHDRKFCFRETANILHQSATLKDGFSAYRAACAWSALGLYAGNLLSQPWRKEYRVLKMYCGFYKHEVEANLVGAEVMLEAMGYKHVGNTTMVLDGPIDPDRVSNVSRDSLMAAVECQLLKNIWEELSCRFQCRWIDILEFRENHVCTPENAVKGLMYQYHQREYQDQHQHQLAMYHQTSDNYGTSRYHQPTPNCLYGQISPTVGSIPPHIGYYNYSPYAVSSPHAYTLPSQPRYGTVMSPQQQAMPYPVGPPTHPSYLPAPLHSVLKSQELYPTNGHGTIHQYTSTGSIPTPHIPGHPIQGIQMALQNGYSIQNQLTPAQTAGPNYGCLVPTGQLIELDAAPPSCSSETQQTFSATDSSCSMLIPRTVYQHQSQHKRPPVDKQETYNKPTESQHASGYTSTKNEQTSKKNKEEGTGTFESWDYVFRNLESQGYNKDLGERPDILSPVNSHHVNTRKDFDSRNPRHTETEALALEDALMEMRLEEMHRNVPSSEPRTMKINEALQKIKLDSDAEIARTKNQGASDLVDCSVSVYDNMSSSPKEINTKQRPLPAIIDSSKCNAGPSKISTTTLPRESKRHGGEIKRLVASNSNYSTATLDPRQLSERPLVSNTSDIADAQVHEKSSMRKNSVGKSKHSDTTVDHKEYLGNAPFYPEDIKTKWECITCTFHNDVSRDICEMCGKSRVKGPESRPLASGGRECPQCTLVNEKDVGTCIACDCSLKDSPTYI